MGGQLHAWAPERGLPGTPPPSNHRLQWIYYALTGEFVKYCILVQHYNTVIYRLPAIVIVDEPILSMPTPELEQLTVLLFNPVLTVTFNRDVKQVLLSLTPILSPIIARSLHPPKAPRSKLLWINVISLPSQLKADPLHTVAPSPLSKTVHMNVSTSPRQAHLA